MKRFLDLMTRAMALRSTTFMLLHGFGIALWLRLRTRRNRAGSYQAQAAPGKDQDGPPSVCSAVDKNIKVRLFTEYTSPASGRGTAPYPEHGVIPPPAWTCSPNTRTCSRSTWNRRLPRPFVVDGLTQSDWPVTTQITDDAGHSTLEEKRQHAHQALSLS